MCYSWLLLFTQSYRLHQTIAISNLLSYFSPVKYYSIRARHTAIRCSHPHAFYPSMRNRMMSPSIISMVLFNIFQSAGVGVYVCMWLRKACSIAQSSLHTERIRQWCNSHVSFSPIFGVCGVFFYFISFTREMLQTTTKRTKSFQ